MITAYLYLIDPPFGQLRYRLEQIIFAGDSAGGNLAVAASLWLRDCAEGFPIPRGLCLMSPWVGLLCCICAIEFAHTDVIESLIFLILCLRTLEMEIMICFPIKQRIPSKLMKNGCTISWRIISNSTSH